MSPWRSRARKVILRRRAIALVARFPLEVGLVGWGFYAVINLVTGSASSTSLSSLPGPLEGLWAILMALAALTVLAGLITTRLGTVATGMYLFGTILSAYSVAVLGAAGWKSGGAIAGFLLIMGQVCFVRGWWLNESETALVEEITRQRRKEN